MNYFCIADADTVRGFRLAGIPGEAVSNAPQAATALERAAARPDCGLLILTESVADSIRSQVDAWRLQHDQPLLVEIPGPTGPMPGHKRLHELVQEAVGLRLNREKGA